MEDSRSPFLLYPAWKSFGVKLNTRGPDDWTIGFTPKFFYYVLLYHFKIDIQVQQSVITDDLWYRVSLKLILWNALTNTL